MVLMLGMMELIPSVVFTCILSSVFIDSKASELQPNHVYATSLQQTRLYTFRVPASTIAKITLHQNGKDLKFVVTSSDGKRRYHVDSPTGKYGFERLFLREDTQTFCLEVQTLDPTPPHFYTLEIEYLPVEAQDSQNLADAHELRQQAMSVTNHDQAERFLRLAMKKLESQEDRRERALCQMQLGQQLLNRGDFHNAANRFRQATLDYDDDLSGQAFALAYLAWTLRKAGEHEQALLAYDLTLEAWQRLGDLDQAYITFRGLFDVYNMIHQSHAVLSRISPLLEWARSQDHRQILQQLLIARSWAEYLLDQPHKAIETLDEAEKLSSYPLIDSRRGDMLRHLGHYEKAAIAFNKALKGWADTAGFQKEAVFTKRRLAELYIETHQLAVAERIALDSLETANNREALLVANFQLARIEDARGNTQKALNHARTSLDMIQEMVAQSHLRKIRIGISSRRHEYLDFYLSRLMQKSANHDRLALHYLEQIRTQIWGLHATQNQRQQMPTQQPQVTHKLLKLLALEDQNKTLPSSQLARLIHRRDSLETLLRQQQSKQLIVIDPVAITDFQKELDKDTAALIYFLGDQQSFLWYVDNTQLQSFQLPNRKRLVPMMKTYYEHLKMRKPDWQRLSQELAEALLPHLEKQAPKKRYLVIADDVLQHIPFETFIPAKTAPQTLLDLAEITYLPTMSHLSKIRSDRGRRSSNHGSLIFFDPLYDNDDRDGPEDLFRPGLRRLENTIKEAAVIGETLKQTRTDRFSGTNATVENFNEAIENRYQILHVATHAFAHTTAGDLSSIYLARKDLRGNPLPGVLPVFSLESRDLPMELVVLSACETGIGQVAKGQPINGIGHSFLAAGAARAIVSLWPIEDLKTAQLMTLFYQNLSRKGVSPSAALREARLSLKSQNGSHPADWSAFIHFGDWDSFEIK